jgi:tRNA 2-selenouridine synthase
MNMRNEALSQISPINQLPRLNLGKHILQDLDLGKFDVIIDVRTPMEFALDHIPGAINCPVLSNEERVIVGTLYKQTTSFDAKKIGAAMVAKNIAAMLETQFQTKPKNWRPLIYCWRGGARSGAMTHIFRQIGWDALQLDGGYKFWRASLVKALAGLPTRFQFIAICGKTGSGKSRLLQAIAANGAQVLDLEALAEHKGSVLGDNPVTPQPSQKMFESLIWHALSQYDATKPIYVEAESKKIGRLQLPDALMNEMWAGQCVVLETNDALRLPLLREEYAHLIANPTLLHYKLDCLADHHSNEKVASWHDAVNRGDFDALISDLLVAHYDPAYGKSMFRNYRHLADAKTLTLDAIDVAGFHQAAATLLPKPQS